MMKVLAVALFLYVLHRTFFHKAFGKWLHRRILKRGRFARYEQYLFWIFWILRIVPRFPAPNLKVSDITSKPLPKGLVVRSWQDSDAAACLDLYRLNAPGRFPPGPEKEFARLMQKEPETLTVIESDGKVVACGGMTPVHGGGILVYGLIRPEFQNRGIGRLLLVSRITRLVSGSPACVCLSAVDGSIGYYSKWGFAEFALWFADDGSAHPMAFATVDSEHQKALTEFLKENGYSRLPAL
jgi:predicted N-acetyltransferase YhbS